MKSKPTSLTLDQLSLDYEDDSSSMKDQRDNSDSQHFSRSRSSHRSIIMDDVTEEPGGDIWVTNTISSEEKGVDLDVINQEEEGDQSSEEIEIEHELLEHNGRDEGGYSIRRTTYNVRQYIYI